ncbi:hypothetical protein [Jiella pelagia]|uniref:Uncharacterized protein n=1 Tax=Jiella pelagia TaxID=2986949 RepID=A0ABY7BZW3_9HYPH|nr:hypothetical protein [Jiella pelagia]WAP69397.1 hypothetical protein OH818_03720 [Jiella pelagia]
MANNETSTARPRQQSVGIMRTVLNRMMEAREREARRYIATHYGKRFGPEALRQRDGFAVREPRAAARLTRPAALRRGERAHNFPKIGPVA